LFNVAAIRRKSPREQLSELDYYSVPADARPGEGRETLQLRGPSVL
jgi:hypothetical protein